MPPEIDKQPAASAPPTPDTSAPAPVSGAPATPATPATVQAPVAPAVEPKNNPKVTGSPANAKSRLNAAQKAEAATKEKAADPAATEGAEATPATEAKTEPLGDFKPYKFTAEGKEHEVKSPAHQQQLLAQGQKFGTLSREHSDLKQHVEKEYGPLNSLVKSNPEFAENMYAQSNQPEINAYINAILKGKASPELAEAIKNGVPLMNADRIEKNVLQREVDGRTSHEKESQRLEQTETHLNAIAEKFGIKWLDDAGNPVPESQAIYNDLIAMVEKGEAKDLTAAFKLSDHYEKVLAKKNETDAAAKAEAKRLDTIKKQAAIAAASGLTGGSTQQKPITAEKGSKEASLARLNSANNRRFG